MNRTGARSRRWLGVLAFSVFLSSLLGLAIFGQSKGQKRQSKEKQLEASLRRETSRVRRKACDDLGKIVEWAAKNGLEDVVARRSRRDWSPAKFACRSE